MRAFPARNPLVRAQHQTLCGLNTEFFSLVSKRSSEPLPGLCVPAGRSSSGALEVAPGKDRAGTEETWPRLESLMCFPSFFY